MRALANTIPKSDVDKIAEILIDHIGKKRAISAHELCIQAGLDVGATHVYCRMVINEVIDVYGFPIIGCHRGFYIANNTEELDEYFKVLETNIRGMQRRKQQLFSAFNDFHYLYNVK